MQRSLGGVVIYVFTMKRSGGGKCPLCDVHAQSTIHVSPVMNNIDVHWFCFFNQRKASFLDSWVLIILFDLNFLCCTFSLIFISSSSLFAWTEHSSFFTPVHCKQPRGKCSLSQPGPSVNSPHSRYLILLVSTLF